MLHAQWQQQARDLSKVIARAWLDQEFKTQLLTNPEAVLPTVLPKEWINDGISFKVDEAISAWKIEPASAASGGKTMVTIPFPSKATDASDEELKGWIEGSTTQYPSCLPNT